MIARLRAPLVAALVAAGAITVVAAATDDFARRRANMVAVIERVAATAPLAAEGRTLDRRVLDAMRRVPRHALVPEEMRPYAYEDRPLRIGYGQTISQPYIVALMTDLLAVESDDVVLELGTGSGYQAAVLAELVREVYSIEIIEPLAERAKGALAELGYTNISVRAGDGYYGWEEHAPFDAIVVTAAASHIPPPLLAQLRPGGRMVIPVGASFLVQNLMLVEKDAAGAVTVTLLLPVRFVPLTGGH